MNSVIFSSWDNSNIHAKPILELHPQWSVLTKDSTGTAAIEALFVARVVKGLGIFNINYFKSNYRFAMIR